MHKRMQHHRKEGVLFVWRRGKRVRLFVSFTDQLLAWPKSLFRFVHKSVQKNQNEDFGQLNASRVIPVD